jgi:hypothetical protein
MKGAITMNPIYLLLLISIAVTAIVLLLDQWFSKASDNAWEVGVKPVLVQAFNARTGSNA